MFYICTLASNSASVRTGKLASMLAPALMVPIVQQIDLTFFSLGRFHRSIFCKCNCLHGKTEKAMLLKSESAFSIAQLKAILIFVSSLAGLMKSLLVSASLSKCFEQKWCTVIQVRDIVTGNESVWLWSANILYFLHLATQNCRL